MREPNLGTTISCTMCGQVFWTEDGVPICSSYCENEYERELEEQQREEEYQNERDEKVQFCVSSVYEFEGVIVPQETFEELSDEELDEQVEWFDYLWTK